MDANRITISLPLPFGMGQVNCYLINTGTGFILIDTGPVRGRRELVAALQNTGCQPGDLKLILITHGDFDHTGNAAHLRGLYGAKIAMHLDDAGMGAVGDMFANRRRPNFLVRALIPMFTGFGKAERFTPDVLVADGDSLSAYGWDARVISTPGHSLGSISLLSSDSDLFCGDLFENTTSPVLNSLMDDPAAARASLQKLKDLSPGLVYPGHGGPFGLEQLKEPGL